MPSILKINVFQKVALYLNIITWKLTFTVILFIFGIGVIYS